MTTQDIDTANKVLDWLTEIVRVADNHEIAKLNGATKSTGMDFYEVIRTQNGSLFAKTRKIKRVQELLSAAKKSL